MFCENILQILDEIVFFSLEMIAAFSYSYSLFETITLFKNAVFFSEQ